MPSYVLVTADIHDPERYMSEYVPVAGATLAEAGGRVLARGDVQETPEGDGFRSRTMILEFPDGSAALTWWENPQYQAVVPVRRETARASLVVVEGIEASTLGGAFLVVTMELTDPDTFQNQYVPPTLASLADFGGRLLVGGAPTQVLEGDDFLSRAAVLEFTSMEVALAWYRSPAYTPLIAVRQASSKGHLAIVQGVG